MVAYFFSCLLQSHHLIFYEHIEKLMKKDSSFPQTGYHLVRERERKQSSKKSHSEWVKWEVS